LARAASLQLAALKTGMEPPLGSGPTNCSRAAFGFGGFESAAAAAVLISPTPSDHGAANSVAFAVSINAPLTWPGVQFG